MSFDREGKKKVSNEKLRWHDSHGYGSWLEVQGVDDKIRYEIFVEVSFLFSLARCEWGYGSSSY